MRDRREDLGRAQNNTLSAFHASLLDALPFAAAYVARDGSLFVKAAVEGAGLTPGRAEFAMIPGNTVEADEDTARKMMKLQAKLEENDDVQTVTTNLDVSPEVAAKLAEG